MIVLLRSLFILWISAIYRLDLVLGRKLPWLFRCCFFLFPKKRLNRGERLRLALERLGPIFIKFGQLLSTRPDLVPPDIVNELDELQDNVPPFSVDLFRERVADELEQPIEDVFQTLDEQPLASASIAQVHGAVLKDGRQVVVKVVRPGIEDVISKDIALLLWIARLLERFLAEGKRLRPVEIVEDYRHTIFDELDLQRESGNASQLRRHFLGSPLLYIPDVIWEYSSKNMMVMERISGIPVSDVDALNAQGTDMKLLAERGVEIFFTQVFEHNFFHADMHPGNIFVSCEHPQQPKYMAVDMAIVGSLTREDQYYLARNLLAMFRRDYRQVAELHVQSGWVPAHTRINEFEAAVRTVCEPVFQKPLADISFGKVLISLFQTAQRFEMEVQPQLVLLQKTLLNIEGLGRQLYPELDLWQTAHPFLERWLKNRYHPKTLYKELKRSAPDWLEKLPQVPTEMVNNFDRMKQVADMVPHLQQAADDYHQAKLQAKRRYKRRLASAVIAIAAIATTIPQWSMLLASVSPLTVGLGVVAIILWAF